MGKYDDLGGGNQLIYGETAAGDELPALIDTDRRLHVIIVSGDITIQEPLSVDDGGGSLTVDDGGGSITTDSILTARWGSGAGQTDEARIDASTNSLQTVTYSHHEVHGGSYFYVKGFADGTQTFLWVTPDSTKWAHANWSLSAEGEFEFYLYEDVVTSDDGTAITIFNANRNSATAATVQGFTGPTLNSGALGDGGDGGDLVWQAKIGSGRNAVTSRSTNYEFIGKQNTKYWFQLTQIAAGTLWVDWDFNWYEHTNKH
jgi:hypothetical protein